MMSTRGSSLSNLLRPEELVGLLLALFVLSGRWSPARLVEAGEVSIFLQLRFWIVAAFLVLSLFPFPRQSDPGRSGDLLGLTRRLLGSSLLFLTFMAFGVGWAPDLDLALTKCGELVLIMAVLILIYRWLALGQAFLVLSAFWRWMFILTFGISIVALSGLVVDSEIVRMSVLAGGPNTFGRMMGLLCLAALFGWVRRGQTWFWIPIAITAACLTVVSGSRGAMLSLCVGLAIFLVLARIHVSRLVTMATVGGLAIFVILSYSSLGLAASKLFANRVIRLSFENRYVAGRDVLYLDALELGMEAPVIGSGLAAFPAAGLGPYPHNIALESFAEGGVLALLLLILVLLTACVGLYRRRKVLDPVTVSALCLVTLFSQFSGDLYDNRMVFVLLLLATVPDPDAPQTSDETHAAGRWPDPPPELARSRGRSA